MSSVLPGARPMPFHKVLASLAMTHAKLLCLSLKTDAPLTNVVLHAWLSWKSHKVGCNLMIGPNRGHCHASSVEQNCAMNKVDALFLGLLLLVGRSCCTGIQTMQWYGSNSVTESLSNSWFMGIVGENISWVQWVWSKITTFRYCIGEDWWRSHCWGDICHFQKQCVWYADIHMPNGFINLLFCAEQVKSMQIIVVQKHQLLHNGQWTWDHLMVNSWLMSSKPAGEFCGVTLVTCGRSWWPVWLTILASIVIWRHALIYLSCIVGKPRSSMASMMCTLFLLIVGMSMHYG